MSNVKNSDFTYQCFHKQSTSFKINLKISKQKILYSFMKT